MKIVGAVWSPVVNWITIDCDRCLGPFHHRADRWQVKCPICGNMGHLQKLREEYVHANEVAITAAAIDRG